MSNKRRRNQKGKNVKEEEGEEKKRRGREEERRGRKERRSARAQEDLVHEAVGRERVRRKAQRVRHAPAQRLEVALAERAPAEVGVELQLRAVVHALHHEHLTCAHTSSKLEIFCIGNMLLVGTLNNFNDHS